MKESSQRSNLLLSRELKPKPLDAPTKALPVHNLAFSYDQEETRIIIYPSEVHIRAKELLNMIDNKSGYIKLANSDYCIRKNDIFSALQLHADKSMDSCTTETSSATADLEFYPPKRPTNAFILYRSAWGRTVRLMFREFNNSQVSKFLGAMWKWSSIQAKEKYIQQANEFRKIYKEKCPNHAYNPKKSDESQDIHIKIHKDYDPDYSDWCNSNDMLLYSMENEFIDDFHATSLANKASGNNDFYSTALQTYNDPTIPDISNNEWEKVCNIISEILPSGTTEDRLLDDQLWTNFQGSSFPQEFLPCDSTGIVVALNQSQKN